jgi:O-antigen ligase
MVVAMNGDRVWTEGRAGAPVIESQPGRAAVFVAEISWLALLIALPAAFDPFGGLAIEPVKVSVLRCLSTVVASSYVIAVLLGAFPKRTSLDHTEWCAVALLASTGLSVLVSVDPLVSLFGTFDRDMGWLTLGSAVVLFLVARRLLLDPVLRGRSISALVLGSLIPCAYAVLQVLGRDPMAWTGINGIVSSLGSPTFLGGYLVLVAPFALYRLIIAGRTALQDDRVSAALDYAWWLATFGVIVVVLVLCNIRGAVLGFVAGTLPMLWLIRPTKVTRRGLAGLMPIGVASALVGMLCLGPGAPLMKRILDTQDPSTHAARSIVERLVLWQAAVSLPLMSPERFVLGFGPEMQQAAFESVAAVIRLSPDEQFDRAHNLFLDAWLTGGLLGLGLLLMIIGSAVHSLRAIYPCAPPRDRVLIAAVAGALAGHLVEQSFAFPTLVTGTFFWVVLAIAASFGGLERGTSLPGAVDCSRLRRVRPLLAGLVASCTVGLMPALSAPAIADAIYGSALEAERTGSLAEAARRAETAATWVPWVADLPLYAGLRWQEVAASKTGQIRDDRLARAQHDLSDAAQRAWWDPYTELRLAQLDTAWATEASDRAAVWALFNSGERACELATTISPYRRAIVDGCAEAERSGATRDQLQGS